MTSVLESRSVGDLAVEAPGAARVFDRLGIDFCCGGNKSLAAACREKGLELETVLQALRESQRTKEDAPDAHWRSEPLQDLMTHIVARHHQYIRTETPRIERWMEATINAHAANHPELHQIRHTWAAMSTEMAQHMAKEELILFPAIKRAAASHEGAASLAAPVKMMMTEHDHSGRDLEAIRASSGDYTPPPDACATYRGLLQALSEFEADMHQHVHLENNILFPRALALDSAPSEDAHPHPQG